MIVWLLTWVKWVFVLWHLSIYNVNCIYAVSYQYNNWERHPLSQLNVPWCTVHNTYHVIDGLGILCTNHLCDFCRLMGVNLHYIPSPLPVTDTITKCWTSVMLWIYEPADSNYAIMWTISYHNGVEVSELRRLWNKRPWWCQVFKVSLKFHFYFRTPCFNIASYLWINFSI